MKDNTCFQDWETITLEKRKASHPTPNNIPRSCSKSDNNDIDKPKKVSNELKIAIQQARMSNKLSQKQLASMMCCQPSLINQYENGKAIPNNAFISKLEQRLKTKLPRIKKKL